MRPHPQAEDDPACAPKKQIEPEEEAENHKTIRRPPEDDDETDDRGDDTCDNDGAAQPLAEVRTDIDADDTRYEHRRPKRQSEDRGGHQRLGQSKGANDEISDAADHPEEESAPGARAEAEGDFRAARDDHENGNRVDRGNRRRYDENQGSNAKQRDERADSYKPTPTMPQPFGARASMARKARHRS